MLIAIAKQAAAKAYGIQPAAIAISACFRINALLAAVLDGTLTTTFCFLSCFLTTIVLFPLYAAYR